MPICPRCHSSMLLQHDDIPGSDARVWRCLGCAQEINADPVRRADDAAIREQLLPGQALVLETRPRR